MEESQVVMNDAQAEQQENYTGEQVIAPTPSDISSANQTLEPSPLVEQAVQVLVAQMTALRQDFDTKVKYDESKERLIDSLHQELQVYREGLHFRVLRPVFMDLITMHDDMDKVLDTMPEESSTHRMRQILVLFQDTIEEMLRRNGVETYMIESDSFFPNKQRTVKVVTTSDATLDKRIARRVRKGFEFEGKCLRSELVETYKYAPQEFS